jgi:thiosulfate dehydrogenase [quinone] large subunit
MHGVSRILSGVAEFASKTTAEFVHTVLPGAVVWPFSAALPIVELILGALLMFGAYTRIALVGGSLLMAALAFGTALRADWGVLGTQLVYSLAYYILLLRRGDNWFSVDTLRNSTV